VSYALDVGLRYLKSKKRATVSVISVIAITGVALGVAALLSVVSITSGFQQEFRDKVLGVNAHVLVLKYGLNFEEYRDVVDLARQQPEVRGAAPFIINEMMLAKDDRLSGVLIKGVDSELMRSVLDLPAQLLSGSLDGLRRPGAAPPIRPENLETEVSDGQAQDLDAFLEGLTDTTDGVDPLGNAGADAGAVDVEGAQDGSPDGQGVEGEGALPTVAVPTPEEMQAFLDGNELDALLDDGREEQLVEDSAVGAGEDAQDDDRQLPGLVVGVTLAKNLGIETGDQVKVISPLVGLDTSMFQKEGASPRQPASRDFRVIGIFEAGFQEYDSRLIYMDLYEAQGFQDQGDTVVGVEITLNDIAKAPDVAVRLERQLGGGPFHTMDWQELNHNLFTALEVQKVILSLVIATIILVAAFNVIATLIMVVLEKRREIAILKAMGARDLAILKIFVVQGAAIGIIGTGIGLLLGGLVIGYLSVFEFPLDPKVYLINHLPVRTSLTEFLVTIAISLLICIGATIIPSWWAARMLPADGIRPQ